MHEKQFLSHDPHTFRPGTKPFPGSQIYYFELAIVNDRMADNNPLESLTRPLVAEVSLKGSLVSEANFTAVIQHKITVPTAPWPKDK
jgi:hypothetical protein